MDIIDFVLGIFLAGSFKPRPARPKIAPEKPRQPQTAYTGGQKPSAWSAEAEGRAAEQLAYDMGVLDVDHFGVLKGMTKSVHDVKNEDGEKIRERVNWKG